MQNNFIVLGQSFPTAEHVYLYHKALFHNNAPIANQILLEDDVYEARKLVKPLETMNHSKWRKVQINVSFDLIKILFLLIKLQECGMFKKTCLDNEECVYGKV